MTISYRFSWCVECMPSSSVGNGSSCDRSTGDRGVLAMKPEALLELPNLPLELLHDPLLFAKDSLELGAPRTAFLLPLRATSHADKIGSGQPVALGEFPKKLSL